jgi:hypothetical protein
VAQTLLSVLVRLAVAEKKNRLLQDRWFVISDSAPCKSTDKSVCREKRRRKEAPFCKPSRYDGFDEENRGAKGTKRCKQRVSGTASFRSNTRPSR